MREKSYQPCAKRAVVIHPSCSNEHKCCNSNINRKVCERLYKNRKLPGHFFLPDIHRLVLSSFSQKLVTCKRVKRFLKKNFHIAVDIVDVMLCSKAQVQTQNVPMRLSDVWFFAVYHSCWFNSTSVLISMCTY